MEIPPRSVEEHGFSRAFRLASRQRFSAGVKNEVMNSRAVTVSLLCIAVAAALAAPKPWVLRFDGAGPVKIGMSLDRLRAAVNDNFSVPENAEEKNCFYAEFAKHPGIAFMVQDGRVTRADVIDPNIATASGIRVGDSEARVMKVYGRKLKVEPHAYTGPEGHYLTLYSRDGRYGLRFETDGRKVTGFYAGESHAIAYIEGCQ